MAAAPPAVQDVAGRCTAEIAISRQWFREVGLVVLAA